MAGESSWRAASGREQSSASGCRCTSSGLGYWKRQRKPSRQNLRDGFAMIDVQALATRDFEFARIKSQTMQDRRVNVRNVVAVLDRVKAKFVGQTVDDSALNARARQPGAKSLRMMIAACAL